VDASQLLCPPLITKFSGRQRERETYSTNSSIKHFSCLIHSRWASSWCPTCSNLSNDRLKSSSSEDNRDSAEEKLKSTRNGSTSVLGGVPKGMCYLRKLTSSIPSMSAIFVRASSRSSTSLESGANSGVPFVRYCNGLMKIESTCLLISKMTPASPHTQLVQLLNLIHRRGNARSHDHLRSRVANTLTLRYHK
jgi:hypothetical protein